MNKKDIKDNIKQLLAFCFMLFFSTYSSFAQSEMIASKQITEVFNKLASAYGSAKYPPDLIIINKKGFQQSPATFYSSPSPVIKVDNNLYNICLQFNKRSNDALAIILSHELAHYYNDDTFCSDFAFAIKDKNNELSNKLKYLSKLEKIKLETEADHKGLFYALMAGYNPLDIYPLLLDKIYANYNLPNEMEGYPSLEERKAINLQVQKKVMHLYNSFIAGIKAFEKDNYDEAIKQFEELNKSFPSRENYNNLGVAKTMKAIQNKPLSRAESKYPDRFKYPLSIDKESRLKQSVSYRSALSDKQYQEMIALLKSAQKDFEKAISLDTNYTQSYINLACVYDLLGNPMAAIGKIKELPAKEQQTENAQRILAIAYYNVEFEGKAERIWKKLKM